MSKKYEAKIKRLKTIQFILVILLVLSSLGYIYFVTRPEITKYNVKDECGPIGGTISHPIDDEDSCNNMCRATCLSKEKEIQESEFVSLDPFCNNCTCFCKE